MLEGWGTRANIAGRIHASTRNSSVLKFFFAPSYRPNYVLIGIRRQLDHKWTTQGTLQSYISDYRRQVRREHN